MQKVTPYFKECPKCKKPIYYSRKDGLKSSINKNSLCRKCSKIDFKPNFKYDEEWKNKVSKCWFKKGDRPLNADFRKGKSYYEIYGEKKANEIKNKFSKRINSKESNLKRSISCKKAGCGEENLGRKCTDKNKKLFRKLMVDRLRKTYKNFHPPYSTIACEYFDKLMKEEGVHIQHALNGGEFMIEDLSYWVDGYDEINNVVYEFDEKRHFDKNGNLKEKDIKRQEEITTFLNCNFIRIKYNEI